MAMLNFSTINPYKLVLWLFIFMAPFLMDAVGEPFLTLTITRILIYALAAISLDFILGYGGMVSLGHAAFFGIGAYSVGILAHHMSAGTTIFGYDGSYSLTLSVVVAMVVSGLFALFTGALSLRTRGAYFIMITLAFAQVVFYTFMSSTEYGADEGIILDQRSDFLGLDMFDDKIFYYLCAVLLFVFALFYSTVVRSRFGYSLRACMQNETRAKALGYNPYHYQLTAYVLSAMGASVAGVLYANLNEFVSPDYLHWIISGDLMVMVIIGGVGTIYGGIIGAFIFIGFEELLPVVLIGLGFEDIAAQWRLFFAPLLLLLVLYSRKGIIGMAQKKPKKQPIGEGEK